MKDIRFEREYISTFSTGLTYDQFDVEHCTFKFAEIQSGYLSVDYSNMHRCDLRCRTINSTVGYFDCCEIKADVMVLSDVVLKGCTLTDCTINGEAEFIKVTFDNVVFNVKDATFIECKFPSDVELIYLKEHNTVCM